MSSGKGLLDTPEIVRCIPEYIVDWTKAGGFIQIKTKDVPFKELNVRNIPIFIGFEQKTEFSCQLDVLAEDQMTESSAEAYRRLKGMECELTYTGSLVKKPAFKPMRLLDRLRKEIPELASDDTLMRRLSANETLMRLLSSVRPDDFVIMLQSFTPEGAAAAGSPEGITKVMAEFYKKPTRMTWLLSLTRMIPRGPSTKSLNRGIFGILKLSSIEILELTKSYLP
ncbi:MAG: hypothetical protein JTT11_02400 [Candidatus Brockarchaeota archaeon]|nr:hypothetical protein [Candidatus Brockarchaeota archaeon]